MCKVSTWYTGVQLKPRAALIKGLHSELLANRLKPGKAAAEEAEIVALNDNIWNFVLHSNSRIRLFTI